jgi:hypothetical protein
MASAGEAKRMEKKKLTKPATRTKEEIDRKEKQKAISCPAQIGDAIVGCTLCCKMRDE